MLYLWHKVEVAVVVKPQKYLLLQKAKDVATKLWGTPWTVSCPSSGTIKISHDDPSTPGVGYELTVGQNGIITLSTPLGKMVNNLTVSINDSDLEKALEDMYAFIDNVAGVLLPLFGSSYPAKFAWNTLLSSVPFLLGSVSRFSSAAASSTPTTLTPPTTFSWTIGLNPSATLTVEAGPLDASAFAIQAFDELFFDVLHDKEPGFIKVPDGTVLP